LTFEGAAEGAQKWLDGVSIVKMDLHPLGHVVIVVQI